MATKTLVDLRLEFYGHFKLDWSRDTAETNYGNTAYFVKNYATGEKDEEMNMSARHTRLGLNWYGPESGGTTAFGNVEIDFLGKSLQPNEETRESQSALRLRHAFMRFDFKDDWSLLAGHTWDTVAPLNMPKLNTLVGWGQGNLGFRRAQLRLTKTIDNTTIAFAVARALARDLGADGDTHGDGEDSGMPDLQGRIGVKLPGLGGKPMKLGLGGFFGWRELGSTGAATFVHDKHYEAYCACVDFTIPLADNLMFIGEVWKGEGLDGYRAAIWQSYVINNGSVRKIKAHGGFGNLIWKPHKKWRFVVGAGVDNPIDHTLHNSATARSQNTTTFGNVLYTFYPGATVGFEYDRMDTDYLANSNRVNHRMQMSFMLKF